MKLLYPLSLLLLFSSCSGTFDTAQRLFDQQHFEEAVSELNWMLFVQMSDTRALQLRAMSYEALEEYSKALRDYKRILQLKPQNASAYMGIGKVHWERRDYALAEKFLLLAAKYDPENPELLILLSRAMIKNEHYESADEFLFAAKKLAPKNPSIYFYRGIVQANLGDPLTTAAQFNMYLQYAPDNLKAHYNRGFAYMRMGATDWALEDFNKVLAKQPDHYEALARRAVCLLDSDPGQACLDLRKAAQKGSKYAKENLDKCM
ncbi:hypothetical protein GCM10028791_35050 [Echinicola sediminis]